MELKDLRKLSGLNECAAMPAAPMNPPSPATVSMTAASGSELSSMLKDIMSLAGMTKVEPAHLGVAPPPMKMTAEPVKAVGPSGADVMRGIADKLNLDKDKPEEGLAGAAGGALAGGMAAGPLGAVAGGLLGSELGNEEKAEEAWDNAPADPEPKEPFDAEEYAHHENPPGAGKGRGTMQPNATLEDIVASLNEEYQSFKATEAKDEEMEEEKSWFDMDSKERAAHVAAGKSKAHRSGAQPGHGPAPAKTSKGDIKAQAADTKAHTRKSEYKGKEDDV